MSNITTQYDLVAANRWRSFLVMVVFVVVITGVAYLCYLAELAPLEVMAAAFFISAIWSFVSYFFSDKIILQFSHARPATKKEFYDFYTVTENLTMGANLPLPALYVMDDAALNAFATGRDPAHSVVCVTTGLLAKLNRHELEAVIGHELSHIRHYDILLSSLVAVLAGALTMVLDICLRGHWLGSSRSNNRGGNALLIIVVYIFAILAPIILHLLQLALSRKREYLADAGSVELTRNPKAMIAALEKISQDPKPLARASDATAELFIADPWKKKKSLMASLSHLFSTHPPIEDRVAALRELI